MSVGADDKINKKNVKMHLANALKGSARVGCAGSSYSVVFKFAPAPGLLSRMH